MLGVGFVIHNPPELRAKIAQLAALLSSGALTPSGS
jgi:hypothetical protein